jgi:P22 coat protein - gene protein 5
MNTNHMRMVGPGAAARFKGITTMAQRILNPSIIAAEALMLLDNNLVMAKQVFRGYEDEFDKRVNGYDKGDTLTVRRPTDFTVRDGAVATIQEVNEGKTSIIVDKQKGVDFRLTSKELTLNISDLSERVMKPAMIQLANQVDADVMSLYADVWNWVGTPGQTVNSFTDFALAPLMLDNGAVPQEERSAVLTPNDYWAMAGSQTALFMQPVATDAYRRGHVGPLGDVDTYMAQNVPTAVSGTRTNTTPVVTGVQSETWDNTKDTGIMTLNTSGWVASVTIEKGMVFTIGGVFAVNPVTKAQLPYLQQFVVKVATTANATPASNTPLTIAPPIIPTGAFKNVSNATIGGQPIVVMGAASVGYPQNMVFHKNAFALTVVPMVKPPGAVDVARKSYKGLSVRVTPYYDGVNDISNYRLDILYGVKALDPRLATRLSGSP